MKLPVSCFCGLLLLAGCGGSDTGSADKGLQRQQAPFTGTFHGTESGKQNGVSFAQSFTLTSVQEGASVSGTWTTSSGTGGTLKATVSGSTLDPLEVVALVTCSGTFAGTAALSGNTLTGKIAGDSACGSLSASFSATKQ